jgi:sterol desaturase/sphingolipid hydroxylase (fatty acid hydroxylase superfamily)
LVVLIVAVVGSLLTQIGPGAALLVGFVVAVPIERIWRRHDFGVRRPSLRTDAFHVLFTGALQTAALVVAAVLCAVALFPLLDNPVSRTFQSLPGWVQAVGGLVAFELFGYWYHRLSHEVGFLWRFHGVHHSSEHLDWIAAARLHPLEGFFSGLLVGPPLLLLGVGPTTLGALGVITSVWAITLHMNVRWRMRALDGIWGTPEYHHWHHSRHPEAINTNYSGLLPILDIAFGTYYMPKDRRPQVYGIDDRMPEGYLAQLAQPFRRRTPRVAAGPVARSVGVGAADPGHRSPVPPPVGAIPGWIAPVAGAAPLVEPAHPVPVPWVPPG